MPNYNNEHVLDLFFSKLLKNNTYDNYELIITDDGSTDKSLAVLNRWQKSGKFKNMVVFSEPHKGIINALNKCLYAAKGEFIIRLDGDATIETKGFIEKFLEFYNIAPDKIGVITTKVIDDYGCLHAIGRNIITPKGLHNRGYIPSEKTGKRTFDSYIISDKNLDNYFNVPAECDTALGVCTFSDRETALKIGGFDYNYPLWIEDDDFYLAYRLYGKKCFYLPNIRICHRFSLRGKRNTQIEFIVKIKNFIVNLIRTFFIFSILYNLPILINKKIKNSKTLWREKILKQDYEYWQKKWGFDCLNPDIEAVKNKYKNTELLWNYDTELKNKGLEIINEYYKQQQ